MSSFVQHFSDGSVWGCIDDFFGHHEYGYIKLKDVSEWYNLSTDKNWKNRVLSENTFHDAVKGLECIRPEPKAPEKKKEKTNPSEVEEKPEEKTTYYKFPSDTKGRTEIEIPLGAGNYYINGELYNGMGDSILEKLREELERRIENYERENSSYYNQRQFEASAILDLLTSLEQTKEEPVANPSLPTANSWQAKIKGVQPQFTPGQEIDHDQVKENIRVMDEQDGKIEPQLPEVPPIDFDQYMTWLEMAQKHQEVPYTVISILLAQAVAVNKFCQTLSRQKTTK